MKSHTAALLSLCLIAAPASAAKPPAAHSDPHLAPKEKPADETPPLVWGYGNRSCTEYLTVYPNPKEPKRDELVAEFQRMREWLGGFSTGLSLATGMDILHGGNLDEAMERLHTQCAAQGASDLFNAALGVFRAMSTEHFDPKPNP